MTRLVRKPTAQPEPDFLPDVRRIAELLSDHKAVNVIAYDVRELTLLADSFIMCSALSEPQVRALTKAIHEGMKEIGRTPLRIEGDSGSGWVVVDYGTIIVHIFRPDARAFYDLDGLWADAPRIPLNL